MSAPDSADRSNSGKRSSNEHSDRVQNSMKIESLIHDDQEVVYSDQAEFVPLIGELRGQREVSERNADILAWSGAVSTLAEQEDNTRPTSPIIDLESLADDEKPTGMPFKYQLPQETTNKVGDVLDPHRCPVSGCFHNLIPFPDAEAMERHIRQDHADTSEKGNGAVGETGNIDLAQGMQNDTTRLVEGRGLAEPLKPVAEDPFRDNTLTNDLSNSSTAAMIHYERMARDVEMASRCATEGSLVGSERSVAENEAINQERSDKFRSLPTFDAGDITYGEDPSVESTRLFDSKADRDKPHNDMAESGVNRERCKADSPAPFNTIDRETYLSIIPIWKTEALKFHKQSLPPLETYHGRVIDSVDAVILIEACRIGLISPVDSFTYEVATKAARPGSIIVRGSDKIGDVASDNNTRGFEPFSFVGSSSNPLPKVCWEVTDPGFGTWTIEAYTHEQELKRPLDDRIFSLIHTRLSALVASKKPSTLVREEIEGSNNAESKLPFKSHLRWPNIIPPAQHVGESHLNIPPDSGYASSINKACKEFVGSDKQTLFRTDDNMVNYTVSELEKPGENATEESDTASIYSDASTISDTKIGYLSEFADELVKIVQPYQPDEAVVQHICDALPDLLRSFALGLGHGSSTPMHRETMVFIHRHRRDIAMAFKERLTENDNNEDGRQAQNGMSLDEIMSRWQEKSDDPPPYHDHEPIKSEIDDNDDDRVLPNVLDEDEEGLQDQPPRLEAYRSLVQGTPTYPWLLSNIRNECNLFIPGENVCKEIRNAILEALPASPRISRQRATESFSASFKANWDPARFLFEEKYNDNPKDAIERALIFTGFDTEVQADTCGEYMRRTWPSTGPAMVQLLKSLVSGSDQGSVTLADDTRVDISSHSSTGCEPLVDTWIDARGTASCIAEIGEQLAWAASALQSARRDHTRMSSKPVLKSVKIGHVSNYEPPSYVFEIDIEQQHGAHCSTERCWLGLVAHPVVVEGYPIQRRPVECPPGLEIPLGIMGCLLDTRKVQQFAGRSMLKGFSSLLVPTARIKDIVSWHLVQESDDKRISYLESQNFPVLNIPISKLEKARHIVGWCPEVKFYAGAADANYKINDSRLPRRCGLRILKDVSLSSSHSITGGTACSLGRKDLRLRRNGYVSKLKWLSEKYITLWDVGEERGWLLNGTSSLLHLVRASLERDWSDPALRSIFLVKEGDLAEASRTHHPNAALEVLLNLNNLNLEFYQVDSDIKFKDRVEDFYDQLEKIYDYQVSGLRNHEGGRAVPRSSLEGWDFQDLVYERDPIYPRHTNLGQDALSWVDFTRSINAVTLFGRDFGEIMRPLGRDTCAKWAVLKPRKSYLAATSFDLNKIMSAKGDPYTVPMKLTHDVVWHIPEASFVRCLCVDGGNGHRSQNTVVQSLLPSTMRRELPQMSSGFIFDSGAVIFGFNKGNKWFWGDIGRPSRTPISLSNAPLKEPILTPSDDSGIGKSLGSSAANTEVESSMGSISHDNEDLSRRQQRPRINPRPSSHQLRPICHFPSAGDYKIGIVCALHIELMAVRALFDKPYPNVTIANEDPNYYALGRMGWHNIVAVCLPHGVYGTTAATDVVSNMRRSFPCLKFCLLVGIGAGVPSKKNDIRLGDVVVSTPSGRYSGVLPYDMIKSFESGASQLNGYLSPPPQTLMCAISELESDPNQSSTPLEGFLQCIQECKPQYIYPGVENDQLFVPEYTHPTDHGTCETCDPGYLVKRGTRPSHPHPTIFYGLIASGNRLMRSAHERDKLGKEHNVLCFEMEGAGIMNSFPCLIIRGICDYADSHKNKVWQHYASAAAAAYARLLLSRVRTTGDESGGIASVPESVGDRHSPRKRPPSLAEDEYRPPGKRWQGGDMRDDVLEGFDSYR